MQSRPSTILIWGLLLVLVLFLIGVTFTYYSGSGGSTEGGGWPGDIEKGVPGLWVSESSELAISFDSAGEYQIFNYQGKTIIGDWKVTDDGLVEAPVAYRNYQGVWYFKPAGSDTLTLDVEELELSETFKKDH